MDTLHTLSLLLLLLLPLLASSQERQVYIAYFGNHNGDKAVHEIEASHQSLLANVKDSQEAAASSLLYSYKHSFNGFAAVMTPDEASRLSKMEGVVSVFPSEKAQYSAQTTRSWELMGLEESGSESEGHQSLRRGVPNNNNEGGGDLLLKARYGSEVIVGVLDSGNPSHSHHHLIHLVT
uniref:Inhibitor I9 domain-containing protein n=1 Tax=Kalanchoe fedtschenkoi TaxID=63787 RepID=A0A7N0V9Q2_KALFE